MLRAQESFYGLERFQADHLIIEVEMMDRNQIPRKKTNFYAISSQPILITLKARCRRSTA